jgi:regulator of cell morphogenesis and NO signaling
MTISPHQSVREIVIEHPETIPALEHFGIDYCCGGKQTLVEACTKREMSLAAVLEKLEHLQRSSTVPETHWPKAPLSEITTYIVRKHHAFARDQLNLIRELAAKVESRHGNKHPEISRLSEVFYAISTELDVHFFCEENILFPYISQLGTGRQPVTSPVFESVEQPFSQMMLDHDHTGNGLRLLREITNNYVPPSDACTTYRALFHALEDFERDLHRHIHLENNILFPRALEQAKQRV